jgi:uncharacterized coiled-coil protein SlyX
LEDEPAFSALRERLDRLENDLAERDVAGRESGASVRQRLDALERRLAEREGTATGLEEALAGRLGQQDARLEAFRQTLAQLHDATFSGQGWVRFGLGYAGHAVARTPHGSFLIELLAQDPLPDGSGYRIRLRIGNSTALTVHQFSMSGAFGAPPPAAAADGTPPDAATEAAWEGSLTPFTVSFPELLPSAAWNDVTLNLPAKRLADLRFIRLRLEILRASLPDASDPGHGNRLVIGLQSKGGFILPTDHGSFILSVEGFRKTDKGHEMEVRFGNPLGFTVTRASLVGRFGPAQPKAETFPEFSDYRFRLSEWQQRLRTFEIEIPGELAPFSWSPKTLLLRTTDPADLAFVECQLQVKNVSLRNP